MLQMFMAINGLKQFLNFDKNEDLIKTCNDESDEGYFLEVAEGYFLEVDVQHPES